MDINRQAADPARYSDALRHATRIGYRYITDYGTHLERFRRFFPREQILVVLFDDFMVNPAAEFHRMMEFLDVDAAVADRLQYEQRNANQQLMFAGLFRQLVDQDSFIRKAGNAILPRKFARALHSGLIQTFTTSRARSDDDAAARAALRAELRTRVEALGKLIDRDLVSLWGFDAGDNRREAESRRAV